jgi:hypothetical protein
MDQSEALLFAAVIAGLGALSLLAGVFQWSWWMKTVGFLPRMQFGERMARWHFILFGLMALGLGGFFAYDALAAPRFKPLPVHPPEQNAPAEPQADE